MELQISNAIAFWLSEAEIDLTIGVNLFEGRMPSSPVNCAVIVMTGGTEPDRYITDRRSSTFQVFIRNTDYDDGLGMLADIRDTLHGLSEDDIGDVRFQWCYAISEGGAVGQDEAGNELFSINFECKVRSQ